MENVERCVLIRRIGGDELDWRVIFLEPSGAASQHGYHVVQGEQPGEGINQVIDLLGQHAWRLEALDDTERGTIKLVFTRTGVPSPP